MQPVLIFGGIILLAMLLANKSSAKEPTTFEKPKEPTITEDEVKNAVDKELGFSIDNTESPLKGVSSTQWHEFVYWAQQGKPGTITPAYNIGIYLLNPRQLEDIGWMKNVRRVKYNGKDVYNGEWISPHSLLSFQNSPSEQYEAFSIIMGRWGRAIQGYNLINIDIDGVQASFSGLLGTAKVAGLQGMLTWSKDPSKYKSTTKAYHETNGMF